MNENPIIYIGSRIVKTSDSLTRNEQVGGSNPLVGSIFDARYYISHNPARLFNKLRLR